ncbi:MAG: hypothetical protein Ct9H300mP12_10700 [Acidimicrobiales bacterium]|nr:MAG: hypothetical protein Ct9H300mP12_10700 [Acidimicrobiales bacterium]
MLLVVGGAGGQGVRLDVPYPVGMLEDAYVPDEARITAAIRPKSRNGLRDRSVAFIFRLPDIGEGLEEAEIVKWFVAIGDEVLRDQPLVEVLTDKASSELPSPVAGTVLLLGANEGTRLQVGEVLIEIDDGSTAPRVADEPPPPRPARRNTSPLSQSLR